MPRYNIKCSKCNYTEEVLKLYCELEKYLKKIKCPKCNGKLENDVVENAKSIGVVIGMLKDAHRSRRSDKSLERKSKESKKEKLLKNDPYHFLRD